MINMPYKDANKQRKFQRDWAKRNRVSHKRYYDKIRKKVIDLLGGKCVNCGCIEYSILEINHINGGGNQEMNRKNRCQKQFYLDILAGRRETNDLEVRCMVCNSLHKAKDLCKAKSNWKIIWSE
jgi:5-methylcytosine-specific restriction endonuclease McrA